MQLPRYEQAKLAVLDAIDSRVEADEGILPDLRAANGFGLDLVDGLLELLLELAGDGLGLGDGEVAHHDEVFGVDGGQGGPAVDLAVHDRLGVAGLVALIVPMPAVAEQVDDHVALELLAELQC